MTGGSDDLARALNGVLSEVIDLVQDVKQAHRKVSPSNALHTELDRLFDDLTSWAPLLLEEEEALGLSPLDRMPSVAGRTPPNLWPGPATDDEVRVVLDEHLARLAVHVSAAMSAREGGDASAALAVIATGVLDHRRRLGGEA